MIMESGLSQRGVAATQPALSYYAAFVAAQARPWGGPDDPHTGIINLCVAEDKLSADLLATKLSEQRLLPTALSYQDMKGTAAMRESLARYISRKHAPGVACDPAHLCVSAGAGAVFDNLAFTLASAGDAFLVPAPWYAAFVNDLRVRSSVACVPVHEPDGRLIPSVAALEVARSASEAAGVPVRAVLLTTPGNPHGQIIPAQRLRDIIAWAVPLKLHVIVDEIYGSSIYDSDAGPPFVSAFGLDAPPGVTHDELCTRVHIVLGFSKDFAASGLRVGVLWTRNAELHKAWSNLGYFCACSSHTQHALANILDDEAFIDAFMAERQKRLRAAHDAIAASLNAAGVKFAATGAGMFVWLDLRDALPADATADDERRLWKELYDRPDGVLFTPGADCAAPAPGFFRACFAAADPRSLPYVAGRLKEMLMKRN
jgi:1-aminocyclopropane-1-carboxylate synthase